MILKLKIHYDDIHKKWIPTSRFHVNAFVNWYAFQPILTEVNEYVQNHNIKRFIIDKNELHFEIEDTDIGYVNKGLVTRVDFDDSDLEEFVIRLSGRTREEVFAKARHREKVIPRSVIYAALVYFKNMSYTVIAKKYQRNHATIIHGVRTSLPSSMLSLESNAVKLVQAVADRYGDDKFVNFCRRFNFSKNQRSYAIHKQS
jgi:hypothetical protein